MRKFGLNLGNRIGDAVAAENSHNTNESSNFLRMRVELNAREPLPSGIDFMKKFREYDILPIKFENLGLYVFLVGKLAKKRQSVFLILCYTQ